MSIEDVHGEFPLELKIVDGSRVFINYWDMKRGRHVTCQIKENKLFEFVYNTKEVEDAEAEGLDIDPFKQKEISLSEFITHVKRAINGTAV